MRRRYNFYGYVQGVGFRWRAKNAAKLCGISGWVENQYDGSVEMEAEGREEDIDKMIEIIKNGRYIDIQSIDVTEITETGESGFEIR